MGDFYGEFDDFDGDDGLMDEEPFDEAVPGDDPLQDEKPGEASLNEHCGPDWEDIAFLGAMSEEISEGERQRRRLIREMEKNKKNSEGEF